MRIKLIVCTYLLLAAYGSSISFGQLYHITDLGTLGGVNSYAAGINASGQVTGYSLIINGVANHAFFYDGATMHDLGTLGGNSFGKGINDSGQVTGYYDTSGSTTHPFLYDGATMHDLGTIGNGNGINATGQVTGAAPFNIMGQPASAPSCTVLAHRRCKIWARCPVEIQAGEWASMPLAK